MEAIIRKRSSIWSLRHISKAETNASRHAFSTEIGSHESVISLYQILDSSFSAYEVAND